MTPTGVGDVEFFIVGREAEPVGFENLVGHPVDLAGRSIDHVNGLLLVGLDRGVGGAGALVIHQRAVAGIGEPDIAVGVDDGVVGRVELLAVDFFREHGDAAVGFVACDAAREVFARDLSALIVEGIAVGMIRWLAEYAHVAVLLEPAQLAVIGDVAPEQVAPDSVPSRAFGPQHVGAVVETLDRGVAELGLETLVERDDVWIGITGRHAAGPIALGCARQRRQRRHGQRRRRAAEKRPAVGSRRRAGCETETGILEFGGIRAGERDRGCLHGRVIEGWAERARKESVVSGRVPPRGEIPQRLHGLHFVDLPVLSAAGNSCAAMIFPAGSGFGRLQRRGRERWVS